LGECCEDGPTWLAGYPDVWGASTGNLLKDEEAGGEEGETGSKTQLRFLSTHRVHFAL
jgi:hypothetical protein